MTKFCRFLAALVLYCTCIIAPALEKSARAAYLGAVVTDAEDGQVLFQDNADIVTPPASMTKLMTFAVLHDKVAAGTLKLDSPVTVTAADSRIGGTQVWLKEGEVYPVEELLYAMMIQSANDAAYALARTAAGSGEAFVEMMNTKARELGMTHTTFRTPHGLPPSNRRVADGDLTTPRDYAVLSRHLLLHTDATKYTAVRQRKFGEGVRSSDKVVAMNNHNHLLGKVAGVDGLKTGFTNGAGYCLAATAERSGRRVIAVVMGSPDSKVRDLKTMELLERGFAGHRMSPPTIKTGAVPAPASTGSGTVPTIRSGAPAGAVRAVPAEQSSTTRDPVLTFRVIPPEKKP